jgi:hypothetical protein
MVTLESYTKERHNQITSYTEMDEWEAIVKALGIPSEAILATVLQKFYDSAYREPVIEAFTMKKMVALHLMKTYSFNM